MDSTLSAQINQRPEFQNSAAELASLPDGQNLKFERADWTSFRTVEGLCQKAGVPPGKLRSLVLKELADNALDSARAVGIGIGELPNGRGYFVEDQGPGIGGTPGEIAALFSIARPMVSTKLLRLPLRGALGNGLRVVAGAVLASSGSLVVITHSKRIALRPERDGTTRVVNVKAVKFPVGTRVEISFGPRSHPTRARCHGRSSPCAWRGMGGPTPAKVRRIGTMHPSFTSCSTPAETRRYAS